jgi:hypothetical protein
MTKQTIEVEGLPEGWKAVDYRPPKMSETYLSYKGIETATVNFHNPWLIVEKIQPRRIVLEELDPWMLVGDFLVYAEAQGYKDFCQLKLLDCAVVMGWYSASKGVFYQCFPPGFEILNHSLIVTHVLPITNSANPK